MTSNAVRLDRLEETVASINTTQATLDTKLDTILAKLANLETNHSTSDDDTSSQPEPHPTKHLMKLDIPRFDGSDAMGWIFKITQFFDYHGTPEDERIRVASFYLDGPAFGWYRWMFKNGQITSWASLLEALELRFAPSYYDDPKGALFKLTQRTTVNAYLSEFESLSNRIVGLQPSFLLSCFISGLSPEIRREV